MIAFAVFLFVPTLPEWSAITVCAIILGISLICVIATDVGRDEVKHVDEKEQKKVLYIKQLQAEVEILVDNETDLAVKTALSQLAEKIRFSDPMSHEKLFALEEQISRKVAELKQAGDKNAVNREIDSLLIERNQKCKIYKTLLSFIDDNYFKRQQKFEVLNKSISVINDYYEETNKDKEYVLRNLCDAIVKMHSVKYVYDVKGGVVGGENLGNVD